MKKFLMSILVAFMLFTITPTRIFALDPIETE